jgi:hypothetical protein
MAYTLGTTYYFRYRAYKTISGTLYHSGVTLLGEGTPTVLAGCVKHVITVPSGADGILIERLTGETANAWVQATETVWDTGDSVYTQALAETAWTSGAPTLNIVGAGYSIVNSDDGYGLKSDRPVLASNVTGTNTGDETASSINTLIQGATTRTSLSNSDYVALSYSYGPGTFALGKVTWSNVKSALNTYFGTLFVAIARTVNGKQLNADVTLTTADIADSTDKRYITDKQRKQLGVDLATITYFGGL